VPSQDGTRTPAEWRLPELSWLLESLWGRQNRRVPICLDPRCFSIGTRLCKSRVLFAPCCGPLYSFPSNKALIRSFFSFACAKNCGYNTKH